MLKHIYANKQILSKHSKLDNGNERIFKHLSAKVLIIGLGGLGGLIAEELCRSLVPIHVVDDDLVHISNLNRQIPYTMCDLDEYKSLALVKRLENIISLSSQSLDEHDLIEYQVMYSTERFSPINALSFLNNPEFKIDLVIDCTDNWMSRFLINDICLEYNIPLIHGAITGESAQWMLIHQDSFSLRDFVSEDIIEDEKNMCSFFGALGPLCNFTASGMAMLALKVIEGNLDAVKNKIYSFSDNQMRTFNNKINLS